MNIKEILKEKNITIYQLSKISGLPKSTLTDICTGKSKIENCSAKTIQQLAKSLNYSMDELMDLTNEYDKKGLPQNKNYLECGLPEFLENSIKEMINAWNKIDNNEKYLRWDCDYCNLQTDINIAEIEQLISSEQAWYLREKYLRIKKEDIK